MAKHHEIKSQIAAAVGLPALDADGAFSVLVTGDQPEMVPVVRERLQASGLPFTEKGGRKFKGRQFFIPIHNVGTPFNADWKIG